jgi:hypothetical protein
VEVHGKNDETTKKTMVVDGPKYGKTEALCEAESTENKVRAMRGGRCATSLTRATR